MMSASPDPSARPSKGLKIVHGEEINAVDITQDTRFVEAGSAMISTSTSHTAAQESAGFFNNPSNFTISDSTIVHHVTQTSSRTESLAEAIRRLAEKALPDAFFDSAARCPPPRCHPDTRIELRNSIIRWIIDQSRTSNLLWLYGPAGIGKSAILQTIAEECHKTNWLGTTFFFSRANRCDDPGRVIPSIVYQLRVSYPTYRKIIDPILVDHPLVLDKTLAAQFGDLIVKPLTAISSRMAEPIVIIVDAVDECRGDNAQQELISLIFAFANQCRVAKLPLVWIISSRPEWQIVSHFSKIDPSSTCRREKIDVADEQSRETVRIFLRDGLKDIQNEFSYAFTESQSSWPTEDQLLVLEMKADGLPLFAETLLRFIRDNGIGNPVGQLDLCLDFLSGNRMPVEVNPIGNPLASLYRGILRNIDPIAWISSVGIVCQSK
ncbi:hypothetical protein AN958_03759 [Leucoagaricus sp. SymC.cos]|nr:hypothetical protein AN958_03759 [Leucoagaricus sp. SymC.cos]